MSITINGSTGISGVDGSASTPSYRGADSNTGISFGTDTLSLVTGGNERLYIDSSGNLGIGTNSVQAKFHVSNAGAEGVEIEPGGISGTNLTRHYNRSTGAYINNNIYALNSIFHAGTSEVGRWDSSGRLLVSTDTAGTVAASSTLQLRASDAGAWGLQLRMRNSGNDYHYLSFTDTNSSEVLANIYCARNSASNGYIAFELNNGNVSATERIRFTNQGAIWAAARAGVSVFGSTTHYHGLVQNSGDQWVLGLQNNGNESGSGYGLVIIYANTSPNGTGNPFIRTQDTSALRFEVRSNGGIANYQSNDANLCDEREKKNIEALDSTWGCLKNWALKKFHYNEDSDSDDKRYGVVAQQVAEHCPEVITDWVKQEAKEAVLDDDGNEIEPAKEEILRFGVKEQQMMWMAIKALQEAQTRIETLEAEVTALKSV